MLFAASVDVEEIPLKGNVKDYSTVIEGVPLLLDLFRDFNMPATFFVTSNVASDVTGVMKETARHNHEIACHGNHLTPLDFQNAASLYANIKSATETITRRLDIVPTGFRAPFNRINNETIKALIKLGYRYDSSVMPSSKLLSRHYFPKAPKIPYQPSLDNLCESGSSTITEIPISTLPISKVPLGLSYMKLLGLGFFKLFLSNLKEDIVVFYLHQYDLFSLPSNMDLPLQFRLMYKRANGLKVLRAFLDYISSKFSPEYICARDVLDFIKEKEPSRLEC